MPATGPAGVLVIEAVGGALVRVTVAVSVATVGPAVTWTVIVRGPAGPSPRPSEARPAGFIVGVGPVASSNWPSPSRSQAYVAVAGAEVPEAFSASDWPSVIV